MSVTYKLWLAAPAGVFLAACYLSSATVDPGQNVTPDAGPLGDSNLPCDVQTMLATNCQSCHSSPPIGGAPISLMTHDDLVAPSFTDRSKTCAQLSVERMQSMTSPMPPGGGATADDIAVLQNWIAGGALPGSCGTEIEAGPNPYDTPVQCSSGKKDPGSQGYDGMLPGKDCLNSMCHGDITWKPTSGVGAMLFAGTVYPTAHEPDLCFGVDGGVTVTVTDKGGHRLSAKVNQYGNFYYSLYDSTGAVPYAPPFTNVQVTGANGHRDMSETAPNGQCNLCHTRDGTNAFPSTFNTTAPGRIMAP